jgi:glutaredoxin
MSSSRNIVIFPQHGCAPSQRAMEHLRSMGLEFQSRDVSTDPDAEAALLALGMHSTPTILMLRRPWISTQGDDAVRHHVVELPPGRWSLSARSSLLAADPVEVAVDDAGAGAASAATVLLAARPR